MHTTAGDAIALRNELEKRLATMISEFEQRTGLTVEHVQLFHIDTTAIKDQRPSRATSAVNLDVRLP